MKPTASRILTRVIRLWETVSLALDSFWRLIKVILVFQVLRSLWRGTLGDTVIGLLTHPQFWSAIAILSLVTVLILLRLSRVEEANLPRDRSDPDPDPDEGAAILPFAMPTIGGQRRDDRRTERTRRKVRFTARAVGLQRGATSVRRART